MSALDKRRFGMASFGIIIAVACGLASVIPMIKPQSASEARTMSQQRDYWPTTDWRSSTPERQGMDSGTFAQLDRYVTGQLPHVYSVLIVRHGYLVFEKYFRGDADLPYEVASV